MSDESASRTPERINSRDTWGSRQSQPVEMSRSDYINGPATKHDSPPGELSIGGKKRRRHQRFDEDACRQVPGFLKLPVERSFSICLDFH